jgi:hypothetical protein
VLPKLRAMLLVLERLWGPAERLERWMQPFERVLSRPLSGSALLKS